MIAPRGRNWKGAGLGFDIVQGVSVVECWGKTGAKKAAGIAGMQWRILRMVDDIG